MMEAVRAAAPGVNYRHATYDGGNPAVLAAVAGEVPAASALLVEMAEMIRGRRLIPLAVQAENPVTLHAPQAYFEGGLAFAAGPGSRTVSTWRAGPPWAASADPGLSGSAGLTPRAAPGRGRPGCPPRPPGRPTAAADPL